MNRVFPSSTKLYFQDFFSIYFTDDLISNNVFIVYNFILYNMHYNIGNMNIFNDFYGFILIFLNC